MERSPEGLRAEIARYDFRRVHPRLRFGTASDRYAGWLGQIYPEATWAGEVKTRTKALGQEKYEEGVLPVGSAADYFEHYGVVELDFTFYRPLAEADGKPSGNLFALQQYADAAPDGARFLLKAPQAFTARTLRRGGKGKPVYEENPTYLDAGAYADRFLAPAIDTLGERLAGVIFEQEYARKSEAPEPEAFVGELDGFFAALPGSVQTHLEIRSPHLLAPPYFAWLEDRGLGFVFSHWTWLPPLREQWTLAGERFTAANGEAVVRLLTPLRMKYADAYAKAYPFDRAVPELSETEGARMMLSDTLGLAQDAARRGVILNIVANNRVFGNAALAQPDPRR